ncbi:MAG TPA: hypothetical protein VKR06_17345, partial [Ktedonosporobacter sp.]|nr:hypothetical protein [Ktedonosporobacter sp.]
ALALRPVPDKQEGGDERAKIGQFLLVHPHLLAYPAQGEGREQPLDKAALLQLHWLQIERYL